VSELLEHPLFGATVTVAVFASSWLLYRRVRSPLLNPVLLTLLALITLLLVFDIPYDDYNRGGSIVSFFLGPAVVALAVPLYREREVIRRRLLPIAIGIGAGALVSIFLSVFLAGALGASEITVRSLAPRSVTTPIAIGIAEHTGGIPALAAGVVVMTGVLGAVAGPAYLTLLRVRDPVARGLALGTASHGLATARALEEGGLEGAVAGLAIGLHGLLAVFLIPLLLPLLVS
jgi:predicted murein hydrolase (TIGR00659 family)